MEELKKYKNQVIAIYSSLSKTRKIGIFAVTGLVLLGLILFIMWASKAEYGVLFSNLNAEDANQIIQKLKEGKIEYKIADGGKTILVPVEVVYEQRLNLAGQGLPKKGTIGFEIFDKTNFGMTEFTEKMDYQRALQGELSRTITQLEGVDDCRIHLVIPKSRLLTEMEKEATASVVLYLKSGVTLNNNQAQGIVHLLCSSVEGLKPENVSVLDNYGNVISTNIKDKDTISGEIIDKYYSLKRDLEKELQRKVNNLLLSVVGPERSVVQVSVEINMDQQEINKETYIPVKGNSGVLRSEQLLEEKYKGSGTPPSAPEKTDQKVPSYPATKTGDGKNDYKRTETVSNYEITSEKIKQTNTPGDIKFISVGVGIDKNLGLSPEDLSGIKDLVGSSIGLNNQRGDQIKVASIAFNPTGQKETPFSGKGEGTVPLKYLYYLGGLILLIGIILALITRNKFLQVTIQQPQETGQNITISELTAQETKKELPLQPASMELLGLVDTPVLSLEDQKRKTMANNYLEDVKKLATEKPEDIAVLFRVWLAEDE